jgi:hypothetical protein
MKKEVAKIKSKEQLLNEGYYENAGGDLECSEGARLTIFKEQGNKIYNQIVTLSKYDKGIWMLPVDIRGGFYISETIIEKFYDSEKYPEYFI